jgi:hypothetical protein
MTESARAFVEASGRLQIVCYKEEIESQLRTPGLGGFQLLGLQDFPGQGTAPVGVVDHFWENKGYVSAETFRRFCAPTVPLARLSRRVFTVGDVMEVGIEVAHFGPRELGAATVDWRLDDSRGVAVRSGRLEPVTIGFGAGQPLGNVKVPLHDLHAPARYRIVIKLEEAKTENDWDVWIYPDDVPRESDNVIVTDSVQTALDALADGRRVLLAAKPKHPDGESALGFTPIFWNTWCTGGQQPHTLGLVCDSSHPALADFPTEDHSNWQWWHVISRAGAFVLDELPAELRPIAQVIDDWYSNRKLALIFEARVGEGRLLLCSADLRSCLDANPVARQLRSSFVRYAASVGFNPAVSVSASELRAFFRE